MFKRFFKSKRGLSPVVASVIMIGAAVATGLAVVAWATSNFAIRQSDAGAFFSGRSNAMRESFVIEDVWFYTTPSKYVNVTVRNVCAVNLTVEAIYFNGTDRLVGDQIIEAGKAKTIKITWTWTPGYYYIVVASAWGNQVREGYSTSG